MPPTRPSALRTRAASFALTLRSAEACEQAVWPACTCPCRGALHGMKHSPEWVARTSSEEYEKQFRFIKPEYRVFYEKE